MGGKSKQSQRTKNNVRPSSSARSAEILNNSLKLDSSFSKSNGSKILSPLFPTLATAVNLELGLNSEFSLCVKKLNKKDPITKTKALQELCELVKNSKADDVASVLPSWAHFYRSLASDPDNKVREYAQKAHGAIVSVCGKRICPQLRQLVPAWLHSQHDDCGAAAAAAHASLNTTFPPNKLPEVLSFCKTEVMSYLIDNLIGNSEANVTKRIESSEEKELYNTRLTTSSLQGLEYFVQHLTKDNDDWLWEQLSQLLQNGQFWKLPNHPNQLVRASWYGALSRIIERYPDAFGGKYGQKTLRIIVGAKEGGVAAAQLWGCLLMYMHKVKDWHSMLDKKDLLIKRVIDILENGGWGDAKLLSTMILPLLSQLPEELLNKQFFEIIFNAMFVGLEKKTVMSSKSERNHWLTSLSECLRYVSIQNYDYVVEVTTLVHRKWLENALSDNHDGSTRDMLIKYSINNMASLVKYWIKQSSEVKLEKYDQLNRNFWQNIGSTILTQIDKTSIENEAIEKMIDGHILLLDTLKGVTIQNKGQSRSITFEGDSTQRSPNTEVVKDYNDTYIIERFTHNLNEVVVKICSHYLTFASEKQVSSVIFIPLTNLLVRFDSNDLFLSLAKQFGVDSVFGFYDKVLKSWISGDTMRCKALINITFFIIKYLTGDELQAMLHSFNSFPPSVIEWCLSLAHSHPYIAMPQIREWLRSDVVKDCVVLICKRVVDEADCRALDLLVMSLNHHYQGGVLVNDRALDSILSIITVALTNYKEHKNHLEAVCKIANQLCDANVTAPRPGLAALLVEMFKLILDLEPYNPYLSCETWKEVRTEWQLHISCLLDDAKETFLKQALDIVQNKIMQNTDDLNLKNIEHVISLCPFFVSEYGEEHGLPKSTHEIINITQRLFDFNVKSESKIEKCALRHECVFGRLNCPLNDNEIIRQVIEESVKNIKEFTKVEFVPYVNKVLSRALYLKTIFLHNDSVDNEDENVEIWCHTLLNCEYFQDEFNKLLYDYVVVCSVAECYGFSKLYSLVEKTKQRLDSILEEILKETPSISQTQILNKLSELAATKGYYWSIARREYELMVNSDKIQNKDEPEGSLDVTKLKEIVSGSGFFHTMQANLKSNPDTTKTDRVKFITMLRSFYLAHATEPEVIDSQFVKEVMQCEPEANVDVIVNAYYRHNHVMLYERELQTADWCQVVSNAAIVDYLTHLVETKGWDMAAHHWDYTTITLCSIVNSINNSKKYWGSTKVSLLAHSIMRLYVAVQSFISSVPNRCTKQTPSDHVAHLPAEWKDIFAPDLSYNLFCIIMNVLESCPTPVTSNHTTFLSALISTTKHLDWETLPKVHKLGEFTLSKCARTCAAVMAKVTHYAYKYTAYSVLEMIEKPLVLEDAEKLAAWSPAEDEEQHDKPHFCLEYFADAVEELQHLVDAALSDVRLLEESCRLEAHGAPHSLALGYLLLLDGMFRVCALARGDLTQHYIAYVRESHYAEIAMSSCVRLLPADVIANAQDLTGPALPRCCALFTDTRHLDVFAGSRDTDVNELACGVVVRALGGAAQDGARAWAASLAGHPSRKLEKIVRSYVSPLLLKREYDLLRRKAASLEDTEVAIHASSNEVVATYLVEEIPIELTITLSSTHPLAPPRVKCDQPAAPNTHWIALYLAYQNGTLVNAVRMFTAGVSRRVEGAAQCCICYCKLQPSTGHVAKVHCRQCNNKFHYDCLRKWFETSTKCDCPLCRAPF